MMPLGSTYPGQTPGTLSGPTPFFTPQGQTQVAGQQPKMNFMAAKSVSFFSTIRNSNRSKRYID